MYNNLRIDYADGTTQRFTTELMRRNSAKELMLLVFYEHNGEGGSTIVSVRFYRQGQGKPLSIHREAL